MAYRAGEADKLPVLVATTAPGKYVVLAGNFADTTQSVAVQLGGRTLAATLPAHSFNTFQAR